MIIARFEVSNQMFHTLFILLPKDSSKYWPSIEFRKYIRLVQSFSCAYFLNTPQCVQSNISKVHSKLTSYIDLCNSHSNMRGPKHIRIDQILNIVSNELEVNAAGDISD